MTVTPARATPSHDVPVSIIKRNKDIIKDARTLLERADKKLKQAIANAQFSILTGTNDAPSLASHFLIPGQGGNRVKEALGDCPEQLLIDALKPFDFSASARERHIDDVIKIAEALNARFEAVTSIGKAKKNMELTEARDDERHNAYLNKVTSEGGNPSTLRRVFSAIMDRCVDYQNNYLKGQTSKVGPKPTRN